MAGAFCSGLNVQHGWAAWTPTLHPRTRWQPHHQHDPLHQSAYPLLPTFLTKGNGATSCAVGTFWTAACLVLPIALRICPNTCLLFVACNSRCMSTLFHKSFGLKSTCLKLRRRSFLHLIIFAGWSHCIAVEGKISLHHFCVETRFCSILQNGARLAIAKHLCLVCIKIKAETRGSWNLGSGTRLIVW